MSPDDVDLFNRARKADILKVVGGAKLYRAGRRLRGPCPLCGASEKKKADGAFSVDAAGGQYFCFSEDKGGDVIDLYARLHSVTPRQAAVELVGETWRPPPAPVQSAPADPREHGTARLAARLWREARPATGSPVAAYLYARGIRGRVAAEALAHLRFHESAFWDFEGKTAVCMPAMVSRVTTAAGPAGGVHVTYLAPDYQGKTGRTPAKRMFGPQNGADGPGGCWLGGNPASLTQWPFLVGEGIESTLSAASLIGLPLGGIVATLSLRALQGGALTDRYGRIDPDMVTADAERAPFTWPGVADLYVAVDRDMAPLKVKVRKPQGGSTMRELTPDERARICGALAESAWRRSGVGSVKVIAPAAGRDFNDELLASRVAA